MGLIEISTEKKNNENIMIHIWFPDFHGCDDEMIKEVVAFHKINPESPNVLRWMASYSSALLAHFADHKAVGSNPLRTELDQTTHGQASAPDKISPPNNFEEAIQNENENIHVRVTRKPSNQVFDEYNDSQKATSVFQYFKENMFTVNIIQSSELALRYYIVCARRNNLSPKQNADFYVENFGGCCQEIFFHNAQDEMTFDEMAAMMVSKMKP